MPLPTFTTSRLILTELTQEDIPSYKKYFVNYEIIKHLASTIPWPYPDDGVEWFVNNQVTPHQGIDKWVWGIRLKTNSNELIGVVDLWRDGKPENRGFWLGEPFWNQGIMTEAIEPITKYAFTKLGFEKLIFSNAKGNLKSRRVKEKTGAKYLRTEVASFVNPDYTEHEIWELTKEEWQKIQRQS